MMKASEFIWRTNNFLLTSGLEDFELDYVPNVRIKIPCKNGAERTIEFDPVHETVTKSEVRVEVTDLKKKPKK